ncbi:MAG: aldo/keto reductase [Desulfuromonas sp.]|nr:MAG: aldo/keto reductase [Desulfuromonas sp.]
MLTKTYGKTGKKISAISFGGMRFPSPDDRAHCHGLIHHAHRAGINYFDTAPAYCNDQSEEIFGEALSTLPRDSYFISSKSSAHSGDALRAELERSLKRLQVEQIDFFHIWHLMNPADWQQRQQGGAIEAALRAKEEGLIGHLVCSSHMQGEELATVLAEDIFEGVLLGYNILNFPYRSAAIELAGTKGLGVMTMNPLGGGVIPQNPERFAFLDANDDCGVVAAALRFNVSNPHITAALVGFAATSEIDQALAAMENFTPDSLQRQAELKKQLEASFDGLCTGCGYCLPCPANIPIPQYLDAYNQILLKQGHRQAALDRLKWHWNLTGEKAEKCTRCGLCEERCTQHLPIIQRLTELPSRKS